MSQAREVIDMPKETKIRQQEQTLREPAPDQQGRPTHEAGGPVRLPEREQVKRKEVLRETL